MECVTFPFSSFLLWYLVYTVAVRYVLQNSHILAGVFWMCSPVPVLKSSALYLNVTFRTPSIFRTWLRPKNFVFLHSDANSK